MYTATNNYKHHDKEFCSGLYRPSKLVVVSSMSSIRIFLHILCSDMYKLFYNGMQ